MCGIYGEEIYAAGAHARVQATLHAMRYRGPDASRVVSANRFALGLARLAIVTTSEPAAVQPHQNARTGVITVLNGEVYNYRCLDEHARSEVELMSDILQAGEDPRAYCDGEYAVAQYNPSLSTLTLYRDRFGVCPLYYQTAPHVAVSSEARRLASPQRVPANGRVLIDVASRSVLLREQWPIYGATNDGDERAVLSVLDDAVASRANHTESGFSVALSGGLDSSLLVAVLMSLGLRPDALLCAAFSERSDDAYYAQQVADYFRLPLTVCPIPTNEALGNEAFDVLEHLDAPPATITALRYQGALRSWTVAKHSPTRVILCGDGVDELVGGYGSHVPGFETPHWRTARKRLTSLRSMSSFNLDRTNKMGMAHSCEFRPPFLAAAVSQALLALPWRPRKATVRRMCEYYQLPREVYERPEKYSADEVARGLPTGISTQ